jgi:HEAT repeat protein
VSKKLLTHKDAVVRVAAIRTVAGLGGEAELPLLIESLIAIPATDGPPRDAAEQAILAACRRADKVERAVPTVIAALPDATSQARCSLIRVLGQLDAAETLAAVTAAAGDEDAAVSQAAFETLGTSPNPRATDALLTMIAEPPAPKLKNPAFMACLRRVVTGRVPHERKINMLQKLLNLDSHGRNASAALAELPWSPSIDSLRLAQSHLPKRGLTEPAASAAVAIAQKLDMNDPKQRAAAIGALQDVLKVTKNDDTIIAATALITQHGG